MKGILSLLGSAVILSATAFGQDAPRISDLAWMAGNWTGTVGSNTVERTCSNLAGDSMMCMMRVIVADKVVWLEFSQMRETKEGILLDTRFFTPDGQPAAPIATQLRLKSATPTEWVFENPNGTQPKSQSVTRHGQDTMTAHSNLVDSKGKASAIDSEWKRLP